MKYKRLSIWKDWLSTMWFRTMLASELVRSTAQRIYLDKLSTPSIAPQSFRGSAITVVCTMTDQGIDAHGFEHRAEQSARPTFRTRSSSGSACRRLM